MIKIEIQDFGKGMESSKTSSANESAGPMAYTQEDMTERIRNWAHKLVISSGPHRGTLVAATIPLSSETVMPAQQASSGLILSSSALGTELAGPVEGTMEAHPDCGRSRNASPRC